MSPLAPHLRVGAGDIASRVVLVRRPEQVEELAGLLEQPREVAWGRGFRTVNGSWLSQQISIVSVGLGGPSVSIGLEEAIAAGGKSFVMLEALWAPWESKDILVVVAAERCDGTSREYFPLELPAVAETALAAAALRPGRAVGGSVRGISVRTIDRVYGVTVEEGDPVRDFSAGLVYPLCRARRARAVVLGRAADLTGVAAGLTGESLLGLGRLALDVLEVTTWT